MPTTELDIRQLADDGGTKPLAPITVPEAVKFKDGEDLTGTIGSIAVIETSPSVGVYYTGDYLVWNGVLYEVIAGINSGDDLVVDTNIRRKTVGEALAELKEDIHPSDAYVEVGKLYSGATTTGTSKTITVPLGAYKKFYFYVYLSSYSSGNCLYVSEYELMKAGSAYVSSTPEWSRAAVVMHIDSIGPSSFNVVMWGLNAAGSFIAAVYGIPA